MSAHDKQKSVCIRFDAAFEPPAALEKVGIALPTLDRLPLNGLRHRPENGTCGWYIWGGEVLSQDIDFFQPLHVCHLEERCAEVIPYLGLPPGYRFLIAPNYEDVWQDRALLLEQ
jgi:hypothetical protein